MTALSFDLTKSTQALSFALQKHSVAINPCQVHLAFDVSYSFNDEHCDGYTQQLLNRFVPFSMLFDKDQVLDSYVFSNECEQLSPIKSDNFADYIKNVVQKSSSYNKGTAYLPIFKMLIDETSGAVKRPPIVTQEVPTKGFFGKLFGKTETIVVETPVTDVPQTTERHLVFFVTDGEAGDQNRAKDYLASSLSNVANPYFVFISIANHPFDFFTDNYSKTDYSSYLNFTPTQLRSLQTMSDEDLYALLLTPSLTAWMNK